MDFTVNNLLHSAADWTIPPLDGSLLLPELYDFHYAHNPTHPVFTYPDTTQDGLSYVRYSELVPAAHRAGFLVANLVQHDLKSNIKPILIASLDMSDTITTFTTYLGILRAGIQLMPISPRNSPAIVAYLLREARPTHLLVSEDAAMQDLASKALDILLDEDKPIRIPMPIYGDLYTERLDFQPLPPRPQSLTVSRIIMHSSGSTSFPKIIRYSDKVLFHLAMAPYTASQNYNGRTFAGHTLMNLYHLSGIFFLTWQPTTGMILGIFPPKRPAIVPSFEAVWNGTLSVKPDYLFIIPVFLEDWAADPEKVAYLRTLKGIVFRGAPLNKEVGDRLVREGCTIYSTLGSTEAGTYCTHIPPSFGPHWEYIELSPMMASIMDPQGDGTFELIAIARSTDILPVVNMQWNKQDAYATNDLFMPHPTIPGLWKLVGRKDDQITLSTGEKTNPIPLEAILNRDPHVDSSIMFGRGRFQNGVLVQLNAEFPVESQDSESAIKYRTLIWPSIQKMNDIAPSHSRLFKEMIIFSSPEKPFAVTPKGTVRRAFTLKAYDAEIDELYSTLASSESITPPAFWNSESSLAFMRAVVNKVLSHPAAVDDDKDIFEVGCDSLQATWIRHAVVHALRDRQPNKARTISSSFVHTHPTIKDMAAFLTKGSPKIFNADIQTATIRDMLEAIAPLGSFSRSLDVNPRSTHGELEGAVLFITGTTGSLGAAVLAGCVERREIKKIYAFNRVSKDGKTLLDRQKRSFSTLGYPPSLALSEKIVLVEGTITEGSLGIHVELEKEIWANVTHVIHNAWPVDFNWMLPSFASALKSMRDLVSLASTASQRPRFVFISSISVLRNRDSEAGSAPEAPVDDCKFAIGLGYSESKWIAEQMLVRAAREASMEVTVIRVGQVSGGINGYWKPSDWVPAIVKSGRALGCLPRLRGSCSWVPLDVAAGAVLDITLSNIEQPSQIVHLVHPKPQPSEEISRMLAERLGIPLVEFAEWVKRLEEEEEQATLERVVDLPALKLLDFFRMSLLQSEVDFECVEAQRMSDTLRDARPLGEDDVDMWLQRWCEEGFLKM